MPKTYPEHIAADLTAIVEAPTCAHPDCLAPGSPVEFGLCVKCLAAMGRRTLINNQQSGYVRVRRDDLGKAIDFIESSAGVYWIGVCERLKAAMREG